MNTHDSTIIDSSHIFNNYQLMTYLGLSIPPFIFPNSNYFGALKNILCSLPALYL